MRVSYEDGEYVVRMDTQEALDVATLVGFIGGNAEMRETANPLYKGLLTAMTPQDNNAFSTIFSNSSRFKDAVLFLPRSMTR